MSANANAAAAATNTNTGLKVVDYLETTDNCVEAPTTNKALLVEDPFKAIQATIAATKANIEADNASILKAEEDLTLAKQSKTAAEITLEGLRAIRKELEEKRKKSFEASDKEMEDLNDSITENAGKIKKASEKKATALEAVKKAEENLAEKKKTLKMKALMLEKHQNALTRLTKGENKSVKPTLTTTTTAETPNGGYFHSSVPKEIVAYYGKLKEQGHPYGWAQCNFSSATFAEQEEFFAKKGQTICEERWVRNQMKFTLQKCTDTNFKKILTKCIDNLGGGGGSKPTTTETKAKAKAIAKEAETPDVSSNDDFPLVGTDPKSKKETPSPPRQSGWGIPRTSAASHTKPTTAKAKAAKPTAKETTTTAAKEVKTPTSTTTSKADEFASLVKKLMKEGGRSMDDAIRVANLLSE